MWQDLFTATRVAQSTGHLQRLACQPVVGALYMHACSRAAFDEPLLGITQVTMLLQFLCPEALVRQHWLGVPQVRRLYRALQVRGMTADLGVAVGLGVAAGFGVASWLGGGKLAHLRWRG